MAFSSATDGLLLVRIVSTTQYMQIYQMWRHTLANMTFVWIMKRFTPRCMRSRNSYVIQTTLTAGGRRHLTLHSSSSSGECRLIELLDQLVFPSDSTRGYMKLSRLSRAHLQTKLFTLNCVFSSFDAKFVTIAGFGYTTVNGPLSDVLKKVQLQILPAKECLDSSTNPQKMCTYSAGKDSCVSDRYRIAQF